MNNYEQAFKTVIDIEGVDAIRSKLFEIGNDYIYCNNTIKLDEIIRKAADYLNLLGGFCNLESGEVNEIVPDILENYRENIRRKNYDDEDMRKILIASEYLGVKIIDYMYDDIDTIPYN